MTIYAGKEEPRQSYQGKNPWKENVMQINGSAADLLSRLVVFILGAVSTFMYGNSIGHIPTIIMFTGLVLLLLWFFRGGWRSLLLLLFFRTFEGFQEIYKDRVMPELARLKEELETAHSFMNAARTIEGITKDMSIDRAVGRLEFKTSGQFGDCEKKLSKARQRYDTAVGVALICGKWQIVQEVAKGKKSKATA